MSTARGVGSLVRLRGDPRMGVAIHDTVNFGQSSTYHQTSTIGIMKPSDVAIVLDLYPLSNIVKVLVRGKAGWLSGCWLEWL